MKKRVMAALGVLNILFVVVGVYYAAALFTLRQGNLTIQPSEIDWLMYSVFLLSCLIVLCILVYLSIRLIRGESSVLRPVALLFVVEILFLVASTIVDWSCLPSSLALRAAGFWERGFDLLTPQYLIGYPLIGAIASLLMSKGTGVHKSDR